MAIACCGKCAEQHGAVAPDQQGQAVAVVTRSHRFASSHNEAPKSGLIEEARGAPHAVSFS